jgi:hypothetical protein
MAFSNPSTHPHVQSEEKSWSPPAEESQMAKLSPIRLSLLRRLSLRKWSKSPEKGQKGCNSMIDVETGGADGNNNNNNNQQNRICTNRKGTLKV